MTMPPSRICQANGCRWVADLGLPMCRHHWRLLPSAIQGAVLKARRAQTSNAQRLSSLEYLEASADAVEHLAAREGHPTRNAFRELFQRVKAQELKTCQ